MLSAVLIGTLLLSNGNSASAQNEIVPIKYIMEGCEIEWYWDDSNQLAARIDTQLVITNITDTHIDGKIVSKNSNYTLTTYNDESVIMAQFGYASGVKGDWYNVAKPSNGLFSIEIPGEYADADYVELWVNSNSFVMEPPNEAEAAEVASDESEIQAENSTSTTVSTNSAIISTALTTTTSTNSTTNSTIITTTKVITIEPVNATESTNSTTTIITTVTTTTITPTDTTTETTTDTTIINSTSTDEEEAAEEEISYMIGGNVTLWNISVDAPSSGDYWIADYVTMFFEDGYFLLDKTPMLLGAYEDYEEFEENVTTKHEHYQTQIKVNVDGATTTLRLA